MDRKVLAMFLILTIGACLTMGCAGKKSDTGATPTVQPTAAAPVAADNHTLQSTAAPGGAPVATAVPTIAPGSSASNSLSLDPSLVDISGEGTDEGGFPENGLPTPTLD